MNKSMTGDGAVVREWNVWRRSHKANGIAVGNEGLSGAQAVAEHNATIRQQAAKIERLTRERDNAKTEVKSWIKVALNFRTTAEASEARTADLLKALERYGEHVECVGEWIDYSEEPPLLHRCTCGLAAAKGGTV